MWAWFQARDQFSKCSLSGSAQGVDRIESSVLKDAITAQSSGMMTRTAQMTSTPCEKTLRTLPSLLFAGPPAGASCLVTGERGAGTAGGVSVTFTCAHLVQLSGRPPGPN